MRNVAELSGKPLVGSEPNYHYAPAKAVEITPQALDVMDKLFARLTLIFPAWRSALPTDEAVAEFKAFWLEELINAKIRNWRLIARGLECCKQAKSPFLPTVGQFIEWCLTEDFEALNLPDEEQLYRRLQAFMSYGMEGLSEFKFRNAAEYWLITDLYCRNRAGEWSEKKLKEELAKALRKMAGRILRQEKIPEPKIALPETVQKRMSQEEIADRWTALRKQCGGMQ